MYVPMVRNTKLDLSNTGDVAWSDLDCTAETDALAVAIDAELFAQEPDGSIGSYIYVAHHDDIIGSDLDIAQAQVTVIAHNWHRERACMIYANDGQNIRYIVNEVDSDTDMNARINLCGYWRWG